MAPFFVFRCKNNRGVNELTCLINKCAYMKHAGDDQALGLPSLNTRKSKNNYSGSKKPERASWCAPMEARTLWHYQVFLSLFLNLRDAVVTKLNKNGSLPYPHHTVATCPICLLFSSRYVRYSLTNSQTC